jgi:hypothetical protein
MFVVLNKSNKGWKNRTRPGCIMFEEGAKAFTLLSVELTILHKEYQKIHGQSLEGRDHMMYDENKSLQSYIRVRKKCHEPIDLLQITNTQLGAHAFWVNKRLNELHLGLEIYPNIGEGQKAGAKAERNIANVILVAEEKIHDFELSRVFVPMSLLQDVSEVSSTSTSSSSSLASSSMDTTNVALFKTNVTTYHLRPIPKHQIPFDNDFHTMRRFCKHLGLKVLLGPQPKQRSCSDKVHEMFASKNKKEVSAIVQTFLEQERKTTEKKENRKRKHRYEKFFPFSYCFVFLFFPIFFLQISLFIFLMSLSASPGLVLFLFPFTQQRHQQLQHL